MGIKLVGDTSGNNVEVNATAKAMRAAIYPVENVGAYRINAISGLITTVAAGTASAGHLFAFRNSHASVLMLISYIAIRMRTIAGFTAAQEFGWDLMRTTSYSASHTGGTAITAAGQGGLKKRSTMGTSVLGDARIATTGALTNGTHTIDAQPMLQDTFAELAAAATVPKGQTQLVWDMSDGTEYPLVLANNEGLIIRNGPVVMGAGGTARLIVDLAWFEVNSYP